jgi:hypothetical protein
MFPAPAWVPHRLRAAWDNRRIDRAVAGLRHTKPTPAADPKTAAAEVHVLVCKRDLRIAALALKSLLRFAPELAVAITDDGTLSVPDRDWLAGHVTNVRWLARRVYVPEVNAALVSRPKLARLYSGRYHPICKLLHPLVLGRTERVIVLDPDTAFFRRPDLLLKWASGGDGRDYYLHDHQDEATQVPAAVRSGIADLAAQVLPAGRKWGVDRYFFNSGLLLYHRSRLNLDVAEGYFTWREKQPAELRTGKPGIWFGDWTPEQTGYLAMFAAADPPPVPLGPDYHLGGGDGFVFNHFLRHYLIQTPTQRMMAGLVRQL